jgi:hypothetical protein
MKTIQNRPHPFISHSKSTLPVKPPYVTVTLILGAWYGEFEDHFPGGLRLISNPPL